jgi:hypothetical protein
MTGFMIKTPKGLRLTAERFSGESGCRLSL